MYNSLILEHLLLLNLLHSFLSHFFIGYHIYNQVLISRFDLFKICIMIYLITGGERSGKSTYAQNLALSLSPNPTYLATAKVWDGSFEQRIKRHQSERGNHWTNIEEQKHIGSLDLEDQVVVIDCVTLWLVNFFDMENGGVDRALNEAKAEFEKFITKKGTFIFVTNEIGMGGHASTEVGRKFVELQGWMNQFIAKNAQKVVLMVSGIPMIVKNELI